MASCVNGHEVHAGDRFCGQCGWAVPAHCPFGHAVQPHQRYCPDCGAALDGTLVPLSPEERQPAPPLAYRAVALAASGASVAPAAPVRSVFAAPAGTPGAFPPEPAPPLGPALSPPGGAWATGPQPAPPKRKGWTSASLLAAVVAGVAVILAMGFTSYALASAGQGRDGVRPSTGTTLPSSAVTSPTASSSHGAVSSGATSPPSPSSTAPSSGGSTALTGDWRGHGGGLHIGSDGQGQATFRAYRFCSQDPTPPCDTMDGGNIVAGGHAAFVLAPPAAESSRGRVTDSNDPSAFQPGFVMTVTVIPGDVVLVTSSPSAQSVAYCGPRATPPACGA